MSAMVEKKKLQRRNWDEEDEEYETALDANGIKNRIKVYTNSKGERIRHSQKIRVRETKNKVPLRVSARKGLSKFGEALLNDQNVTLQSQDFIKIEHPDDVLNEPEGDDVALGGTLTAFIQKQQERAMEREHEFDRDRDFPTMDASSAPEDSKLMVGRGGAAYVPPSMRAGGGGMGSSMPGRGGLENAFGGRSSDDSSTESTIKVSNLTKSVTEDDIKDLFGRFGGIWRVSLPKQERKEGNTIIKEPKGFAYVAYYTKKDAEAAMEKLQGHGYDHLILKLEWARPQKDAGGGGPGGGGDGGGYRSGYGQALAQDTKERVSYASNLTGNSSYY